MLDAIDIPKLTKRMAKRKRQPSKTMAAAAIEAGIEDLEVARFEEGTIEHESYVKRRAALVESL